MPTKRGGLPQVGEVWSLTRRIPGVRPKKTSVVILERNGGPSTYWSVRVAIPTGIDITTGRPDGYHRELWVDAKYAFTRGELRYVREAGEQTKKELGLA